MAIKSMEKETSLPGLVTPSKQLHGRVLITGGAGFIGRALVRTAIQKRWDCSFTIVSRDEQKQDFMKKQVAALLEQEQQRYEQEALICEPHDWPTPPKGGASAVKYAIMDINDTQRLADVMVGHETVIHAAALKYIPEAEREVAECLNVNLQGSMSVATAARSAGVDRVVALSTDKATSPLNVYGATKFLMERLYAEMDIVCANLRAIGRTEPHFTTVRYGNVIGSTGSVIPNFLKQLETKGRVFITDPNMTRFWISFSDAIDLICEAATCDEVGVTVIPRPRSMAIGALAEACRLVYEMSDHGGCVTADSNFIEITGIRPGEKMDEALVNEAESLRTIDTGPFYYLMPPGYSNGEAPFALWSDQVERFDAQSMKLAIREAMQV